MKPNIIQKPPQIHFIITIITGLLSLGFTLAVSGVGTGDFFTYYAAAEHVLQGKPFVGENAGMPSGPYVYLPITVLFYVPLTLFSPIVAYGILFCINIFGALLASWQVIRLSDKLNIGLTTQDKLLITGAILLAPPLIGNLLNAQPNFWLLVAFLTGYQLVEKNQQLLAGIMFALPAIFKLWPALLGVWLVYRCQWKAVVSALATGTFAIITSVGVFGPATNIDYFRYILYSRSWTELFAGGLSPEMGVVTIRRPISILFPNLDPVYMALIGVIVLLPILLYYYSTATGQIGRLVAFEVTVIIILLILPSITPYFIFPFAFAVPLLYVLEPPQQHIAGVASVCIVFIADAGNITTLLGLSPVLSGVLRTIVWSILQYISIPLIGCLVLLWVFRSIKTRDSNVEKP
jgi:hypothetical protein